MDIVVLFGMTNQLSLAIMCHISEILSPLPRSPQFFKYGVGVWSATLNQHKTSGYVQSPTAMSHTDNVYERHPKGIVNLRL
jgi:hypothetical protein